MADIVVWNGPHAELVRLAVAIDNYCDCPKAADGTVSRTCAAHQLLNDQRTMDHLAFVATVREHYLRGEWTIGKSV